MQSDLWIKKQTKKKKEMDAATLTMFFYLLLYSLNNFQCFSFILYDLQRKFSEYLIEIFAKKKKNIKV